MTKTLTEQWKDGTLPRGGYYIKLLDGSIKQTNYDNISKVFDTELFQYSVSVKEVLAPVPDYQTWKDFQQHFVDKLELEVKLKKAYEQLEQESIKVVEIQEQLNEANEMLKGAKHLTVKDSNGATIFELVSPEINEYLKKWGVK